jgi:hypothetical protein
MSIARPNPILALDESINKATFSPWTSPNGFKMS